MNKNRDKLISISAAIAMMIPGVIILIGWFTRSNFLSQIFPGKVEMNLNAALCFVFASIVLILNYFSEKTKALRDVSQLLSVLVSLIGLWNMVEYIYGFSSGINRLFFQGGLPTTDMYHADRMSQLSAVNFILAGICLYSLNQKKTVLYQFYYLFSIAFVSLLMLIGLIFIPDIPGFIDLSVYTAIGFIVLAVAIYFGQPMLQTKFSFERKLFTGFTAVIILIAVLTIFSSYYSDKRISTSRLVEHTNTVLSEADQTVSLMKDIESGGRGYIITGDSGYLKYFEIAKVEIRNHIKRLKTLIKDNPLQQARIDSLSILVDKRIGFSVLCIQARNEGGIEAANKLMGTDLGRFYTDMIRNTTGKIQETEDNLLIQRKKENDKNVISFNYAFIILLAGVFLLLAIILFSIRNNITIRKKAEAALTYMNSRLELKVKERTEKLAASEERFRSIIEQYPSPVIRYSPDGTLISANPAWEIMWQDKVENVTDYNIRKDPQMIASGLSTQIEKAFAGEVVSSEVYQYDPALIGKTGRKRWLQMLIYPLKDAAANIVEVILILLDMTDNKEAEEKLDRSEKRFRALVENNEGIIGLLDEKLNIIYRSPAAERITGYALTEIKLLDTNEEIHPDDRQYVTEVMKRMLANPGKSIDIAFRSKHKSGQYIWLEGVVTNLFDDPSVRGIITNLRDITARKEAEDKLIASEKQFRHTLDNMLEGAQIIGFDWRYKYVNDSMARHGKYSKEELLGYTVMEKYPGIEQTFLFTVYEKCLHERVSIHLENEFTFPDKTTGWFQLSFQPVTEGIFILSIDITDRKKAQFEIQKLNEELEQKVIDRTIQLENANKELEAFSYSVSHDLRAPLRAVNGFAKILEEHYKAFSDNEGERLLNRIMENARKMGLLIDDLLEFSRLGRREVRKSPVQMKQLFDAVLAEMNTMIAHSAEVKIHDLHSADADSVMIKQVMINLLSNAIKYSSKTEKPFIEVKSCHKANEIIYSVRDNGIGFNNQYAHKLFGVFQRLHLQSDFEGTGVGLALVKRIIDKHGGSVWASGELHRGATFFFSLPVTNNN